MKKYKVIEDGIEYTVKEYSNDHKYWYFNDEFHRINGPACKHDNGDNFWYFKNRLHRINGPACEWANGEKWWYINGIKYPNKKDYYRALLERNLITKKEAFIELI